MHLWKSRWVWRNKAREPSEKIQSFHVFFVLSAPSLICASTSVYEPALHILHGVHFYNSGIYHFPELSLWAYLQVISGNSLAHFKQLLAMDSVCECSQGCGDIEYRGASQVGFRVEGVN